MFLYSNKKEKIYYKEIKSLSDAKNFIKTTPGVDKENQILISTFADSEKQRKINNIKNFVCTGFFVDIDEKDNKSVDFFFLRADLENNNEASLIFSSKNGGLKLFYRFDKAIKGI